MRIAIVAFVILTAAAFAADPCAQPTPEEMAAAAGVKLPKRPWHVANIWWDFEKPVGHFTSLEMDVTIDRDVPETYNLYVSPCGIAEINGLQFYGGIQSNINGWANKESRKRVHPGRGAIFSRWSSDKKTPIGLEHVRTAADECLVESAGYEGEFASVRRPFAWKQGTYTWSVTKGETVDHKGAPATWFTCRVKDKSGGPTVEVGSLLFEGKDFTYWAKHSAFVEVYSTERIPKSNIPKVNVTFGWPRINDEKAAVKKASAYYPDPTKGVPGSPDCATVRADGDKCVVEVGAIFKRDEAKRRHSLEIK
ncbi:DUF3472 domain-containing protein [Fimbriiglobus ruber]|uniref:Secreted protein n=1 Tax=Fimbriiglobus ruber TaxID=1908690 RepID=A0A225D7W1_9BACT|nr:hypothetical protein [Fimbriiglobus ruber]OWK37542.1 secreted protein [Fimbriiglobus ruber]